MYAQDKRSHLRLAGFGWGRSLDQNDVGHVGRQALQESLVEVLAPGEIAAVAEGFQRKEALA